MNKIECHACRELVREDAVACSKCGASLEGSTVFSKIMWYLQIILNIFIVVAGLYVIGVLGYLLVTWFF